MVYERDRQEGHRHAESEEVTEEHAAAPVVLRRDDREARSRPEHALQASAPQQADCGDGARSTPRGDGCAGRAALRLLGHTSGPAETMGGWPYSCVSTAS